MTGASNTFARGDSTGSTPNAGKVTGIVSTWETSVSARESRSPPGMHIGCVRDVIQWATRPDSVLMPRIDRTESVKPIPAAFDGSKSSISRAAAPSAEGTWARLPDTVATCAASTMANERKALGCSPLRMT